MVKLFYTGAPEYLAPQQDKDKSLGGFISSTEVPNDFLGNLFGGLSRITMQNARNEFRAIAIQNVTGATLTGLKVNFVFPVDNASVKTNMANLSIGYKVPTADSCANLQSEAVANIYATPYSVTFVNADGSSNALALPNLDNNQYLVLYLKRSIIPSTLTEDECYDLLEDIFDGTVTALVEEKISMVLSWN